MRKVLIGAFVALFSVAGIACALDTSDPQDDVYKWLDIWHRKGYISQLPYLKPYPLQLIDRFLGEVAERAGHRDRKRAERFLEKIDKGPKVKAIAYVDGNITQDDGFGMAGFYATTSSYVDPRLTASGRVGGINVLSPEQWYTLPPGQWPERDYMVDWAAVTVEKITVLPTVSANGLFSLGSDGMWFQAGLTRNSFGPFDEGPVLSPQAVQAGHFSFTWRRPRFIYTDYILALTATKDDGTAFLADGGVEQFPHKYLGGQSFQFRLWDWLELGFYETIVFGERLELLYTLPVIPRTYSSIIVGVMDNMLLGVSASATLPADLRYDFMLYTDDLHFLDVIKLDFDTKYKVAIQTGLSWTPLGTYVTSVSADYTMVTPYTYTHRRESITDTEVKVGDPYEINYYNYTNAGRGLVALEPNSDRIRLTGQFQVPYVDNLEVRLHGSYRRHANATTEPYVSSEDLGTTDGGINDNGFDSEGLDKFTKVDLLSQGLIEKVLLLGVKALYGIRVTPRGGDLSVFVGYTLELVWNKRGDDPNHVQPIAGNDLVRNHLTFGSTYLFGKPGQN